MPRRQYDPVHPVHHSIRYTPAGRVHPRDMSSIRVPHEYAETMQRIAISIFTDCVNVGVSFQEALSAVYVSGLQHGMAITKEPEQ